MPMRSRSSAGRSPGRGGRPPGGGAGGGGGVQPACIRAAVNRDEFLAGMSEQVEILDGAEEARLAFLGATQTLGRELPGVVGVVDVGGGSTEIAVGTVDDGVR